MLPSVAVVASRRATRDELTHYLAESGFRASALTTLDASAISPRARGLVLFPDDFAADAVDRFLSILSRAQPALALLVVTRMPSALERSLRAWAGRIDPVVLPRPPFGWSIVDALRGRLGGST